MSVTTILYKDIAPGASEDATVSTSTTTQGANPNLLLDGIAPAPTLTCELNHWLLSGEYKFTENEPMAFWSDTLSDKNGEFSVPPIITISFGKQYSSVGLTLVFDLASNEYCNSINIKWYQGEEQKDSKDFYPNAATFFCRNQVESYDRIIITINGTAIPYRRAKLEQIIFGIHRRFGMSELRSASIVNEMNLIETELPISTMNWTLDSNDNVDFMFQLKQPVEVRNNNSLIGVYYIESHSRFAKSLYSIGCYDLLGIMDETPFAGGAYLSGTSAKKLLEDIVGGDFAIEYSNDVVDTTLIGILQSTSKRISAQQVLFAWGVCAATDGGDSLRVFNLPKDTKVINENRTYTGVTVDTAAIVTSVSVTAHTYEQDDNGSIEINGIKYSDTTTVYTVSNPNVTASDKQNVVEITNATLVSASIGQAVAQRVYDYYLNRNTNNAKIVWAGEQLGDLLTLPNTWGGVNTGHVSRMEIKLSNTVAANCKTIGL